MTRKNKNTKNRKSRRQVRGPVFASRRTTVLLVAGLLVAGLGIFGVRALVVNWADVTQSTQELIAKQIDARVKTVMVSGTLNAQPAELRTALGLKKGASLVGFDAQAARERIQALDWVQTAGVVRVLPSTVKVEIEEYTPLARLEEAGDVWIIAEDGHQITKDYENFEELPVLRGKGAKENAADLFEHLAAFPELKGLIAGVYVGERRWDAEFASGAIVKLPAENVNRALEYLHLLNQERRILDVADVVVDLRLENKIVLRLPEGGNNYL